MASSGNVAQVAHFIDEVSKAIGYQRPVQQHLLLAYLFLQGETAQSKLSDALHVTPTAVTRHITVLGMGYEGDGPEYVENYADMRNRREKYVRLTPKGKALMERIVAKVFKE